MTTAALPAAFIRTFRDFAIEGVPSSGKHRVRKADARALGELIQSQIGAGLGTVTTSKATKALLDADLAHPANSTGLVYGDAAGANNDLYVKTGGSGSGGWTNTGALHAIMEGLGQPYVDQVQALASAVPGVFRAEVADAYLRAIFRDLKVEGSEPGHDWIVNYETARIPNGISPGVDLYRAQVFFRNATLGLDGPVWNGQGPDGWWETAPATVFATQVANGSVQPGYLGATVTAQWDWDAVVWTHNITSYNSPAESGIDPRNILPKEQLHRFLTDQPPAATTVVGSDEVITSVEAAVEALLFTDGSDITRSTFPNSNLSTPSRPQQIVVLDDDHDEEITSRTFFSNDTGLRFAHWLDLVMPRTARLFMPPGGSAPVIEGNFPFRARGGVIENLGDGYGYHIDNQTLPRRAVAGPAVLRHRNLHLIEDQDIIVHGVDGASCGIGGAVSNGMHLIVRRVNFRRAAGTAPHVAIHTVPNTTDAGLLQFEDCIFEPGVVAVQFLKNTAMSVRHKVVFINCEGDSIQCANTIGDGVSGFVRAGPITGFGSVSNLLEPVL